MPEYTKLKIFDKHRNSKRFVKGLWDGWVGVWSEISECEQCVLSFVLLVSHLWLLTFCFFLSCGSSSNIGVFHAIMSHAIV